MMNSDTIERLNRLWKEKFEIERLELELEKLQEQRHQKYGSTLESLHSTVDEIRGSTRHETIQSKKIEEELPPLMQQVKALQQQLQTLHQKIHSVSLQCNELRCVDPERVEAERMLRLAAEEHEYSRNVMKEWESKLTTIRNKRNRSKAKMFHEAQQKSMEIEKARSLSNKAKERRHQEQQLTLQKTMHSQQKLQNLKSRNEELQKEYEIQLKEEEMIRRKIHRMEDFVEQNEAIVKLLNN
jgi:chromosome segregation ATPase